MVEARFVVNNVQDVEGTEGRSGKSVNMQVDYTDPVFQVATPAGSISMIITSEAAEAFILGDKYRVIFEAIKP